MQTDFQVASISIDGNTYFETKTLRSIMLTNTPALFRKAEFTDAIFRGDLAAIENHYTSHGFLEAAIDHELVYDSTENKVDIRITIHEGMQTLIERIDLHGNTVFNDDTLKKMLVMDSGEHFNSRHIETDNFNITAFYDDQGYADVKVSSERVVKDHRAIITHTIAEGQKQYIDTVEFAGLERTREDVVRREAKLKQDGVFRHAGILQGQRNLYRLGVFRTIRVETEDADRKNYRIVRYLLTEKELINLNLRIGYGTQDYVRFGFIVTHLNLLGRAWQGTVDGKASFTEIRLGTNVSVPHIAFLPRRLTFGVYYQDKDEKAYNTRTFGSFVITDFEVLKGILSVKYDFEGKRTYYPDYDSTTHDWLPTSTTSWLLDRRDNLIKPRKGYYFNIIQELSGVILPSDVCLTKTSIGIRTFKSVAIFVTGVSMTLGMAEPIAPSTEVPLYKRYYCGGATSVRGYSEWSIGPTDEFGNPLGGRYLFQTSGEFRFPVYKSFGGVAFIDAGNVWPTRDDISTDVRWGAGAGLRYTTPIGSIRLDYGIKIDRREDESFGQIHFAIGEAF